MYINVIKKISFYIIVMTLIVFNLANYALIVSDNDGSAFVTKAEFDALRFNFSKQVDDYNLSIDNKIDGAIASYLAGIKIATTEEQVSLLNRCEQKFNASFAYPTTSIATSYLGYVHLGYGRSDMTTYIMEVEWKVSNNNGSSGKWEAHNGSTNSIFLEIEKVKYGTNTYYAPIQLVTSMPKSGIKAVGWDQGCSSSTLTITRPTAKTYTYSSTQFGTEDISFGITMAGSSVTIKGFYYNKPVDTFTAWSDINNLPGKAVTVATLKCIDIDEMNDVGPSVGTVQANCGWCWGRSFASDGTKSNWQLNGSSISITTAQANEQKATVYRHKSIDKNSNIIINSKVSSVMGEAIYYHEGLPLFTAMSDGMVTAKLKFVNSAGSNTTFSVSNAKYTNSDITGTAIGLEDVQISSYTVGSGTTATLSWRTRKNETYWIKALPSSGITTITSESIAIQTE